MKNIKPLTLKNVIETLAIYDIKHCVFPHNYLADIYDDVPYIRGLALGNRKQIYIDNQQCEEELKETVIHELIHCKHFSLGDLKGYGNIEKIVERETNLTYKLLYGHKL